MVNLNNNRHPKSGALGRGKIILIVWAILLIPNIVLGSELKEIEQNVLLEDKNVLTNDIFLKSKIYIRDGIAKGRIFLKTREVFGLNREEFRKDNEPPYLKQVTATVDDTKVLDVYFNSLAYVSYTFIKFKFKDFSPQTKKIDYSVKDSYGRMAEKSFQIKRKGKVKQVTTIKENQAQKEISLDSKVWRLTKVEDIFKTLYKNKSLKEFQEKNNSFEIERYCTKGSSCKEDHVLQVPGSATFITFESNIELDSVALFNLGKKFPLITFFQIPSQSLSYLGIKFYFLKSGNFFIIAQGKDKQIYQSKPFYIDVTTIKSGDEDYGVSIIFTINKS